jgi:uncharacterized damage-inducible protein DinB
MERLKYIRELLEKFYEGATTSAEEAQLRDFFSREKVPEELQADRELFVSMASAAEPVEVPADLNKKILSGLSEAKRAESRSRRIGIYSFSALAAGLLILFSVYLGFLREDHSQAMTQYAIEDPELAYEEAKKALEYVSAKWNDGTSELNNLHQVNKTMETVSTMKKLSSGSKELNLLGNLRKADQIQLQ